MRTISLRTLIVAAGIAALVAGARGQQVARDTPAQNAEPAAQPSGVIAGRVLVADAGRPLRSARVTLSGSELPGGRRVLTDDQGTFEFMDLPAGRYTLSASRSGFVSLQYGQRRPLQAGTPLQLAEAEQLKNLEIHLPRGSVVTGHVYDETGEPMPGILVRVLRYQYQQGERRLAVAGTTQTDDLGQFRVWGLMPGEYYVDARSRINLPFGGPAGGGRGRGAPGGAVAGIVGALGGGNVAALFGPDDEEQRAYAPTYFPGVTSIAEAQPITVGLSQTVANVAFGLQLVPVARVSGRVTNASGQPTANGNVTLAPEAQLAGRGNQAGLNYGSRIGRDGTFAIANVPPGRYVLRARGNDSQWPQFGSLPLTVGGDDIADLTVTVADGATIVGTVSFPPTTQSELPDLRQIRISSVAIDRGLTNSQARVEEDGSFRIVAVPGGVHLIRPTGQLRGWTLKSVVYEGRDITDTPMEVRSGQEIARVTVTLTNAVSEINGTIATDQGAPVTAFTVLAFSTDPTHWSPQSRHIATARPDQTGRFRLRGLPAGTYYLATVDPAQQGEWYEPAYLDEHRFGAARVTLGEGETKTQDFRLTLR